MVIHLKALQESKIARSAKRLRILAYAVLGVTTAIYIGASFAAAMTDIWAGTEGAAISGIIYLV